MAVHWIDRGDLWKNKARILQIQLRERLRVAVDRRIRRPMFSDDGYFSSTMTRLLSRFRNFRRDSLATSSAFYRRRKVNKDIFVEEDSAIIRMLQALAVPVVGNVCHVFMHGLNRVQVYGAEKLHEALMCRHKDTPLITVSNHVASIDDPFVISSLLPPHILMDARDLRWTLCATDRCFKNPVTSAFFRSVKVLPVARGDGIHQKGLDIAISKLNAGGWVHIFPEGSRSRDGGKTVGSAKRGVARLVLDSDNIPIVIPFVHTGMQDVMPIGAKFPRIGNTVTVLVGDPIQFDDLLTLESKGLVSRKDLYDAISLRIGNQLRKMKDQVDKVAQEQKLKMQRTSSHEPFPAARILHQQVEWELFGMDTHTRSQDSLALEKHEQATDERSSSEAREGACAEEVHYKAGYWYGGGIGSRIQGYKQSMEMIGFAARGLVGQSREKCVDIKGVSPLRAWKQFLEANVIGPWNHSNVV